MKAVFINKINNLLAYWVHPQLLSSSRDLIPSACYLPAFSLEYLALPMDSRRIP